MRSLTGPDEPKAAFTDTVGVLTSWTGGTLRITRRDGRTVALREAALVAGKPVPAAPARRRGVPAASVRELQWVAARGWPAVETERLGEWTLRASPVAVRGPVRGEASVRGPVRRAGFTSRANSVLPLGDPGLPLDAALRHVQDWYAERGLPAKVQVATGHEGAHELLAARLDERGWTADRHTLMRTGALAPLADRAPDTRVRVHRRLDADWLRAYGRAEEAEDETAPRVLSGGPSVWFATVPGEGEAPGEGGPRGEGEAHGEGGPPVPAAIGRCVVDGRWAGFAAIEVAPAYRRQGFARAVMAELARTALAEGASAAYLQVEADNDAARALYDGLGFADHHAYHYRTAPRV